MQKGSLQETTANGIVAKQLTAISALAELLVAVNSIAHNLECNHYCTRAPLCKQICIVRKVLMPCLWHGQVCGSKSWHARQLVAQPA